MKSVGESMGIGRTFSQALQKAARSLETGRDGLVSLRGRIDYRTITAAPKARDLIMEAPVVEALNPDIAPISDADLAAILRKLIPVAVPDRIFYLVDALRVHVSDCDAVPLVDAHDFALAERFAVGLGLRERLAVALAVNMRLALGLALDDGERFAVALRVELGVDRDRRAKFHPTRVRDLAHPTMPPYTETHAPSDTWPTHDAAPTTECPPTNTIPPQPRSPTKSDSPTLMPSIVATRTAANRLRTAPIRCDGNR
jgi:hypothetical protein